MSDNNESTRPASGRAAITEDANTPITEDILKILKENPTWGIQRAIEHLGKQGTVAVAQPVDQPVTSNEVQSAIVEPEKPEVVEVAAKTEEAVQPPVPDSSFIAQKKELVMTPLAMPDENVVLPKTPEAEVKVEEPKAPAANEATETARANVKTVVPKLKNRKFEDELATPLDMEKDTDALLLGSTPSPLSGTTEDTDALRRKIDNFYNSLETDSRGNPLFRSEKEEDFYMLLMNVLNLRPPYDSSNTQAFTGAIMEDDRDWSQRITLPSGRAVPGVVQHSGGKSARAALRRKRRSGSPLTLWLPASGFYVSYRSPDERDFCEYDFRTAQMTQDLGLRTYGLLMGVSSGVYIRNMVEFALMFVTDASVETGNVDLKTALLDRIDTRDYWLVIIGVLIAKYPTGLPYILHCLEDDCKFSEEKRLNLRRCIRYADSEYTDLQREIFSEQRYEDSPQLTIERQNEYVKAHRKVRAATFLYDDYIKIDFKNTTLGEFFDATEDWIGELEDSTNNALKSHADPKQREQYIRISAESRRLTRYSHAVEAITVTEDVDGEPKITRETDRDEIKSILSDLSADRRFVRDFEKAHDAFVEQSRVAVFGYMSRACPLCGKNHGEEHGPFRGIVTLSPDRIFFTVSRVVSEIQKLYIQVFGDIG